MKPPLTLLSSTALHSPTSLSFKESAKFFNSAVFPAFKPFFFPASRRWNSSSSLPKIMISSGNSQNIFFNLSLESTLVDLNSSKKKKEGGEQTPSEDGFYVINSPTLFIWRNSPCVVIGKHQNPWNECKVDLMREDGVDLARRYSGGGAVYQDYGNTCFTFFGPKKGFSIKNNNAIILAALKEGFGIEGKESGRNDLTVDDRKFSGSAFKHLENLSVHHGTILRDVESSAFGRYLTPNQLKLQSKGVSSVAARVINLKEINEDVTHEAFSDSLVKSFCSHYGVLGKVSPVHLLNDQELKNNEIFTKHYELLRSWEWNFGKTPLFNQRLETRFPWGHFELYLHVNGGIITEATIHSDCLSVEIVDVFSECIKGATYSSKALSLRKDKAKEGLTEEQWPLVDEFFDWLAESL